MTGKLPYADKSNLAMICEVIVKKNLPPRPDFSHYLASQVTQDKLWNLLVRCWAYAPMDRITVMETKEEVSRD